MMIKTKFTRKTWRRSLTAGVALVALLSIAGAALGGSPARLSGIVVDPPAQTARPMNAAVAAAFTALRDGAPDLAGGAKLKDAFVHGAADSNLAHADFAHAVAVPISGSAMRAWIVPSGDHVCVFVPDPSSSGIGATCSSLDEVRAGLAVLVVPEGNGQAVVAIPSEDGAGPPQIESARGAVSSLPVQSNVAAAVVPASGALLTKGTRVDLATPGRAPQER